MYILDSAQRSIVTYTRLMSRLVPFPLDIRSLLPTPYSLPPIPYPLLPILCLFLLLAACTPQPLTVTREPVALRLVAADSCGPLAEELAAAYEETHPWVTVQVEVFNSSVAERTLRAGEVDLAMLSWLEEVAGEEALWSHPFARDGVAVIVHPATPFTETGLAHLQEIFRGRVQEWGGMVLTVVSREEGSGARAAFEAAVLGGYDVTLNAVVMPSSEAVIEYVANTPGAVGYVSTLWVASDGESVADGVRVLPVEGALPTLDAVSDGSYPLSRPLYLAATTEPAGEAREFAQWVLGPEGQAIACRLVDW
jgi:phosphate transport system substrate-binding protein